MISCVLPALDEEEMVGETVAALRRVFDEAGPADAEIVVVDDGSADRTGALAEAQGARVLRHPTSGGYGLSLKTGIRAARFDTIVICDADGTYPVETIPRLLEEYRKGFDMVVGRRNRFRDAPGKGAMRRVLRWLVQYTAGRQVPDVNSGLRVFSRETVLPYLPTLSDTFSFTTSLTLAYLMTGRFVSYVPVGYRVRRGRTKVRLLRDSLRTLQNIVQSIIYYNPLKLFILFSAVCLALSALGFLLSALFGLLSGFLLGVGAVLVALIVFCAGLLAELLRQILAK